MVSKTIGHLDQTGSISNYDLSLCIKERKEVLEWWNQELVNQGLKFKHDLGGEIAPTQTPAKNPSNWSELYKNTFNTMTKLNKGICLP